MTFSELKVTIKDSEKRLSKEYPSYEVYQVHENDPFIKACMEETLDNFNGEPDDIDINIKFKIK